MKKLMLVLVLVIVGLTSCQKSEDVKPVDGASREYLTELDIVFQGEGWCSWGVNTLEHGLYLNEHQIDTVQQWIAQYNYLWVAYEQNGNVAKRRCQVYKDDVLIFDELLESGMASKIYMD